MSCFKNKVAEENFKELIKVFENKNTALTLISANNGYSLEFDKDGNPSVLFKQIMDIVENREQAFTLKSAIYKKAFLNEPLLSDISKSFADDSSPTKRITANVMKSFVYEQAIMIGITVKPKGGLNDNVKKAGTNTLHSDNPARTAGIINSRYDQDVASVENGYVLINPSDAYIEHMVEVENKKQADTENLRMINEFIQGEEEANYHILKPFDNYGNPLFENTENTMEDAALPRELTKSNKQGNFIKYKAYLKNDIAKLQQRLNALKGKNKTTYDRNESQILGAKIARIQLRIEELKKRTEKLTSGMAVLGNIEDMANEDLTRVQNLISSKSSSRNLIEARDIIAFYMPLGEFVVKADHPFFKDNTTYNNKEMIKVFEKIRKDFKKMQGKLDEMNKEHIKAAFISHRNVKEIKNKKGEVEAYTLGDTKIKKGNVLDYLFGDVHDIDKLSALFLDPTLTYDAKRGEGFSESIIPQIMSSLFVNRISKKTAYGQEKMAIIDTLFHKLRNIIKGDYSIFYQKDSRGFQTEFLINPFKSEWFSLKTSIELDNKKRFERIRKDGQFIDVRKLPEVKEAFKNAEFGFAFGTIADSKRYSERLKEKIGAGAGKDNYEYQRIVDSQIKLIDQFTFERAAFVKKTFPEKTVDDLSPKEKEVLKQYDLEFSPFHVFNVPETNQHSHIVDGKVVQITPSARFNEFIPNDENIEKYKDERFEVISDNPEMYRLWNEVSEVLLYINNVLASVGQDRVTFNSLLSMEKEFRKQIGRTDLPLGSMVKNAHSKTVEKIVKGIGINKYEFTGKEDNEESINYGKMKSTKVLVDRKYNDYLSMLKTFNMEVTDGIKTKKVTSKKDIPNNARVVVTPELVKFLKEVLIAEDFEKFIEKDKSYGFLKKAMRTSARQEIIDQQRMDLPKVLRHFVSHAIRVDAANEVAPTILLMQNYYNQLKTPETKNKKGKVVKKGGKQRIRGEKRVDQWIETAVKGNFAEKGAPIGRKILTPEEKKEKKFLQELGERLRHERESKTKGDKVSEPTAYEESIFERIENLGREFDAMFPLKIAHPIIMFLGMAFNFVSGARNVAYGIISNVYHDAIGDLWTRGNSLRTTNFVMGKGRKQFYLRQPLKGKADIMHWERHGKNLVLADMFLDRSKIIQDMRNEKQRASNRLGKTSGSQKLNPYYLSITAPEWRNQSITILSTLMDERIKDSQGNESLVFNGNEFLIYDDVDEEGRIKGTSYIKIIEGKKKKMKSKGGILKLKPEYRYEADGVTENTENINNWEKMSGGDYRAFRENAISNVKIVHGDYSNVAGIPVKNTQFGAYWMIFLGWLPAMIWSYWGHGPNLAAGKIRQRSVLRSAKPITATLFTASITMGAFGLTSFGWPLAIGAGAALAAGIIAEATRKEKSQVPILKELWVSLAELTLTTINIPIALATKRTVGSIDLENKLGLTKEEAGAMRGILINIGMRINLILMSNMLYKFATCEEDTWMCKKRIMARNFLINNAGMLLDDLAVIANPLSLIQTMSTDGSLLRFVLKLGDFVGAAEKLDKWEDVITTGEFQGGSKTVGKLGKTFMPSIFKYIGVNINADWNLKGVLQGHVPLTTTPVSMDRIFDERFLFVKSYVDYNKYDRYETIREVLRDRKEDDLEEENKGRADKWTDTEIDAMAGKSFPTLTGIKNRMDKRYGKGTSLAKRGYEKEIDDFLKEHD